VSATLANEVLLQELNQYRNQDADFRISKNFWYLVPISRETNDRFAPLQTRTKVAHRISLKNKISLKKFQVI